MKVAMELQRNRKKYASHTRMRTYVTRIREWRCQGVHLSMEQTKLAQRTAHSQALRDALERLES